MNRIKTALSLCALIASFYAGSLVACGSAPAPTGAPHDPTYSEHGWREIPAPRRDLQCWTRWNTEIICAPSLTATHGASP